ncbi:hypothetical protein CMK11_16510, partial [Candidatus Poribacteria bacterium]|nr:hypothetical protein [Candidatus Poribacteria bacterium]
MRRRRRGWSETSGAEKSGRGVVRDFSNQIDMPAYQDRTVPVERAVLYRLLRRWAPVGLAIAAIALGPFAGGWYHERRSAERQEAHARTQLLAHLRGEIEQAAGGLREQAAALRRVEAGDLSQVAEVSRAYPMIVWRAASLQLGILGSDASFQAIASFYARLDDVDHATTRYLHAADHARWAAGADEATSVPVTDTSRLRMKVEGAAQA